MNSSDPFTPPIVDAGMLVEKEDVVVLRGDICGASVKTRVATHERDFKVGESTG